MRRAVLFAALLSLAACTAQPQESAAPDVSQVPAPTQNFVVFFQEWSAALDHSALTTIARAAAAADTAPSLPVSVTGYADPTGSKQANVFLSETRAQVVLDQLVKDGVAATRLHRHAVGIVGYRLTTQESRRVVIALGHP